MTTTDLDGTFAKIVAIARHRAELTAAAFDYDLIGGMNGRAGTALSATIHDIANEGHPEVTLGASDIARDRAQRADELHTQLIPHIETLVEAARAKRYTGWSSVDSSTVRYAR